MTRDEWNGLVQKMNAAWPANSLTAEQEVSYFDALKDLRTDQVSDAIIDAVRRGAPTPPGAQRMRTVALAPRSGPVNVGTTGPTGRLVVDVPSRGPQPKAVVTPYPTAPLPPTPPVGGSGGGGPMWPSERRGVLTAVGIGVMSALVAAGLAVGLTFAFGPDEDAAYKRGVQSGHSTGYTEGQSAGYDTGYDAGKESVFSGLSGADPIDGSFYIVKYENGGIGSWFDYPVIPGMCYRVQSSYSNSTLQRGIFC